MCLTDAIMFCLYQAVDDDIGITFHEVIFVTIGYSNIICNNNIRDCHYCLAWTNTANIVAMGIYARE